MNYSAAAGTQVTSGTTATVTPGVSLSAGVRIVVFVEIHNGSADTVSSVTDTLGNSYTQDVTTNYGAGVVYGAIYSATNKIQGKPVITANFTALSTGFAIMGVSAYNGAGNTTVDVSASTFGVGGDASLTTTPTTGYNQLVVNVYFDDGSADPNLTRGGDFNLRARQINDSNTEFVLQDKNSPKPEAVISKVVYSGAGNWGMLTVVYKTSGLPSKSADELNPDTSKNYQNVAIDDGDYFIQYGSEYMIQEFKKTWTNSTDNPTFSWNGRTTQDTRTSPLLIQIYNVNSSTWETVRTINTRPADVDFFTTYTQTTNVSNYYSTNNTVTFRIYQQVI